MKTGSSCEQLVLRYTNRRICLLVQEEKAAQFEATEVIRSDSRERPEAERQYVQAAMA